MDTMNSLNLETFIPGGYQPAPQILLYNFQEDERSRLIRRYLRKRWHRNSRSTARRISAFTGISVVKSQDLNHVLNLIWEKVLLTK